jgi:hypothetical protein
VYRNRPDTGEGWVGGKGGGDTRLADGYGGGGTGGWGRGGGGGKEGKGGGKSVRVKTPKPLLSGLFVYMCS